MDHQKVIKINLIFVAIMAISGLYFGFTTGSKSVITDGIVSTVILASSSLGLFVHTRLFPNDTNKYPYGKWRFEYIYNFMRMVTLLVIITYSFFESLFVIFHYHFSNIIPKEVLFSEVLPYFILKLGAVILSMLWLKKNFKRNNIDEDSYTMEYSSVVVDGCLTLAIMIGIIVFSQIAAISKIADAVTLLIVAIILGVSVYEELKHLVLIMIGKRIFVKEEEFAKELIESKYPILDIRDIYVEKHGMVTMYYIHCSYDTPIVSSDLHEIECGTKAYLKMHHIEKPRLHFYFE